MPDLVIVLHSAGDESHAESVAAAIQTVGYDVWHTGLTTVGDIELKELSDRIAKGGPIVICGTARAAGSKWLRKILAHVQGPNSLGTPRVFPVRLEIDADLEAVGLSVKVAECARDFAVGITELRNGLLKHYPLTAANRPVIQMAAAFLGDYPHLNYDRRPVVAHGVEALDQKAVQRFLAKPLSLRELQKAGIAPDDVRHSVIEKLEALGCICDGHPNHGAFLCFARRELLLNMLSGCSLQMAVFDQTKRGTSAPSLGLAKNNLLTLYEEGMTWLTKEAGLKRRGQVGRSERDDLEIPELALHEALANALAHRDYESDETKEQPTRLEVFPDRVEITSFGNLPEVIPLELLNRDSDEPVYWRRNPVIAQIFLLMSRVELLGGGVSRMRSEMEKASLAFPRFIADLHQSVVRVVLLRPAKVIGELPPGTHTLSPRRGQLRVMLSSTLLDLREHRKQAAEACIRCGMFPLVLEYIPASSNDSTHVMADMVAQADVFIGIYGFRYGSVPEGEQVSLVESEFNKAVERGIPILLFFMDENHPITRDMIEVDDAKSAKLAAFKRRASEGRIWHNFTSAEDLRDKMIQTLAGLRIEEPVESTRSISLHTLPPVPPGFTGREADLEKLRAVRERGGVVLSGMKGMGGIGKTALALVLAHEWAPHFPDAQLFLDGRGTQPNPPDSPALMAQVIHAFHPDAKLPDDPHAIRGIYHDLLRGKKVLLLLDNAPGAAQATQIIPPEGCALLVTSRFSFTLGNVRPHEVGRLPDPEAIALLRQFHPGLTDDDAAALAKLCAGLPLALRLAGSRLALDGEHPDVAGYLRALRSGRLAALDPEAEGAGEITISETLRLSEATLSEPERAAWRKLGVFTASFDARAAAAIAGADEGMLRGFVRRSLLDRESPDRYQLHDLAADYARTRLDAVTLTALHLAHAGHYTAIGEKAEGLYLKGDAGGGLALFDAERLQIEAAYTWLAGRKDEAAARQMIALVNAVVYTGDLRFHPRQRIAWLESQLRSARIVTDRQHEGNALGNLGLAHYSLGDARKAIQYQEQYLAIAREIGSLGGEGKALGNLGLAHLAMGDARKAIDCSEQYLAIAQQTGDRRGEGFALGNLGRAHASLGDVRKAAEFYDQQLMIVREIGDRRGEGNALGNLGNAHFHLGDTRKSIEYQEHYLTISREIGDRRGEGNALGNLGNAHFVLGDARKAMEFYEQCLAIDREIGDRRGEAFALWNAAIALDSLGNRAEAIARAAAALAIYEAIESPEGEKVRAKLADWRGK